MSHFCGQLELILLRPSGRLYKVYFVIVHQKLRKQECLFSYSHSWLIEGWSCGGLWTSQSFQFFWLELLLFQKKTLARGRQRGLSGKVPARSSPVLQSRTWPPGWAKGIPSVHQSIWLNVQEYRKTLPWSHCSLVCMMHKYLIRIGAKHEMQSFVSLNYFKVSMSS